MKKISKYMITVIMTVCIFILPTAKELAFTASAATTLYPQPLFNLLSGSTINDINKRANGYLTTTSSGYMRLFYDGKKINIENYDSSFNITSTKTIAMELDIWGGFYKGSDAYYLVEGTINKAEKDDAEVVRVIKYDFNWNKKGTAKITANGNGAQMNLGRTRIPFQNGNVNMTEYNGTLYIATSKEGYIDSSNGVMGHQGLLMIAVNESTMEWSIPDNNSGHSDAQYIIADGSNIYLLEQSEGKRCTQLSVYNGNTNKQEKSTSVFDYGGTHTSEWAIDCFASVDGLALSDKNVLGIGTSIDQSNYDSVMAGAEIYNIYLTVTPKSNLTSEATTIKWLADFTKNDEQKYFDSVKLTKINNNRFLVSWGEAEYIPTATDSNDLLSGRTLHYVFIDGNGNKLTQEYTAKASISDCQPIVNGSKVVFFASSTHTLNFYTIDANSGAFSKKTYRKAGESVTWDMSNDGTLTLSGTGTISTSDENEMLVFDFDAIKDTIKTIKISEGITSIEKEAFIEFRGCRQIYLPDSITSIGKDGFWTKGFISPTIYCNSGSYAQKYAEDNDIYYVLLNSSSSSSSNSSSSSKPSSSSNSSSSSSSKPSFSSSSSSISSQSSSSVPEEIPEEITSSSEESTPDESTPEENSSISSSNSSVNSSTSSVSSSQPVEENNSDTNSDNSSNSTDNPNDSLWIIIAIAGGAAVVIGIVIAVVVAKRKK